MKGGAPRFLRCLGVRLVAVGVPRYVPEAGDLLVSLLNVNLAVACFGVVVGAVWARSPRAAAT